MDLSDSVEGAALLASHNLAKENIYEQRRIAAEQRDHDIEQTRLREPAKLVGELILWSLSSPDMETNIKSVQGETQARSMYEARFGLELPELDRGYVYSLVIKFDHLAEPYDLTPKERADSALEKGCDLYINICDSAADIASDEYFASIKKPADAEAVSQTMGMYRMDDEELELSQRDLAYEAIREAASLLSMDILPIDDDA